jgi:O-antigen/teichoic acid export membrane protein
MSLRANVIANYAGQIYTTVINLMMVPVYLRYMGMEAYGLVGFFAMLQMWFQLLDMGLTPTMSRETARFCAGVTDVLSLRRLLRTLEGIFIAIAVLGTALMIAGADFISLRWLKVETLPIAEVRHSIMIMALLIGLRWIGGLYRGTISGMEKQVWLNGFNVTSTTVRCVLAIPLFWFVGSSPTDFFALQLLVAVLETGWLLRTSYRLLPLQHNAGSVRFEWGPLRPVLVFTLSVAFTSAVWVLVTQTDKLILSKLLPLGDYAYFTLAVLAAGGIMLISGPITTALQPRMTTVTAAGDDAGMIRLYKMATQLTGVVCLPAVLVLAFFPEQVLWAWTGNPRIAQKAGHVLSLYALGNGVLTFSAFPYFLQFAKGDMKLHVWGNAVLTVLLVPGLIWATINYGMDGAGYAWLSSNLLFFFAWVPLVHRRFVRGLHLKWLTTDVAMIILPPLVGASLLRHMVTWPQGRIPVASILLAAGLFFLLLSASGSSWLRQTIMGKWHTQRSILFTEQG